MKTDFHFTYSNYCTFSATSSAPCGTGQTTIDIGCDPALPRNCVDHPADSNLFKNYNLIKFAIIWLSSLNYNINLWNCRAAPTGQPV